MEIPQSENASRDIDSNGPNDDSLNGSYRQGIPKSFTEVFWC